jgi:hypothetical protein
MCSCSNCSQAQMFAETTGTPDYVTAMTALQQKLVQLEDMFTEHSHLPALVTPDLRDIAVRQQPYLMYALSVALEDPDFYKGLLAKLRRSWIRLLSLVARAGDVRRSFWMSTARKVLMRVVDTEWAASVVAARRELAALLHSQDPHVPAHAAVLPLLQLPITSTQLEVAAHMVHHLFELSWPCRPSPALEQQFQVLQIQ